ncbi:radical SAM protein [Streptococcus agalactiae]
MLKPSQYNVVKKKDNKLIIFNTLTGKKLVGDKDIEFSVLEKISKGACISEISSSDISRLTEEGFLVSDNDDEFENATHIYRDIIADNVLELTIVVTDGCNFKCGYCYQEERKFLSIADNVLDNILQYIHQEGGKYRVIRVNWFGGEPMLAFDKIIEFMKQCIEICKYHKIGLVSGMTTNGYLLTSDRLETLIKHKVFMFQITLDGSRNTHNKLRPHINNDDSYDVIIDNLKSISLNVKKYYEIIIRINLTKSIASNIEDFIEEIKFLKKNRKIALNCQKMSNYGGNSVKLLFTEMIDNKDFVLVYDSLVQHGFKVSQQPAVKAGAGLCSACKPNSFYIDQRGNILKCSLAIYDRELSATNRIGFIDKVGNMVIDSELENSWIIREEPDKKCYSCKFYPICFNHYCPFRRLNSRKKVCYGYRRATIDSI